MNIHDIKVLILLLSIAVCLAGCSAMGYTVRGFNVNVGAFIGKDYELPKIDFEAPPLPKLPPTQLNIQQ